MRIAIVHDYLNQFGGAERVLAALHEIYPSAPIFTSIYDAKKLPAVFSQMDIRTSFMQKLPLVSNYYRQYLLFYPIAFEQFDLSEYDVILSSSSAFAKGVRKKKEQLHICYCHTPMRFVWRFDDYVKNEKFLQLMKGFLPFILEPIKQWDLNTAQAVDYFVANSKTVSERIRKIYGRDSVIINPPVEADLFKPALVDRDYFLVLSRLIAYKRVDLAIEACKSLDLSLKIIGCGLDEKNLKALGGKNIEFLGRVNDLELKKYLAECRALIFPGEEDFGIVPLEAMACGRPVIAYRAGGAEETVIEGKTGTFFDNQTSECLAASLEKFNFLSFDKNEIRKYAESYDKKYFKQKIEEFVEQKYHLWQKQ